MPPSVRDNYLTAEVQTAPPQKLHLLLLEAALRSCERVRQHWRANQDDLALEPLIHAEEIVNELVCGLNRQANEELARKLAAVYLFVFRCLVDAGYRRDEKKLADAIRVLEIERETWRQACNKLAVHRTVDGPAAISPPLGFPGPAGQDAMDSRLSSGFSLEA
jgi:flagellar secretion chaperone FliS